MRSVWCKIGSLCWILFMAAFCAVLVPFVLASIPLWYLRFMPQQFKGFWYNLDRTLASGTWATTQETISSEVGRIAIGAGKPDGWTPRYEWEIVWTKAVARWLNTATSIWGANHTKNAILHADLLDHADDGREQ